MLRLFKRMVWREMYKNDGWVILFGEEVFVFGKKICFGYFLDKFKLFL